MKNKTIRLTEQDLRNIIKESVHKILEDNANAIYRPNSIRNKNRELRDKLQQQDFNDKSIMFGNQSAYIREAVFQILGCDRFSIEDINNDRMPNPWEDIFHILKYLIDNKGLNQKYLRKVSNKDWQAQSDKYGIQPDIMSSDDWQDYIEAIHFGEQNLFTREELRHIASLLPNNPKQQLYHDLMNIRTIGLVEYLTNYALSINNGNNAKQFLNTCKTIKKQLTAHGKKITRRMIPDIVRQALQTIPLIPQAELKTLMATKP